mmetsp:Transcript_19909/g.34327  ORF Transcript_19909/g.34327 Transcript_19909/m.34327 type:complete len:227 (+) Transcript_19909:273-953(+)
MSATAHFASSRAATPGSTLPSSSSREAPPPVEMWESLSATPACSAAATLSPPPTMVMQPWGVKAAKVLAMAVVPVANLAISNTPIGPFQITVLEPLSASSKILMDLGPISKPIQPSGIAVMSTTWVFALASNLSAMTTSTGRISSQPLAAAMASSFLASSIWSSSTREPPTLRPRALKKVKIMPPPMMTLSAFSMRLSTTVILLDTLEPPTMATKGRLGALMAPSR